MLSMVLLALLQITKTILKKAADLCFHIFKKPDKHLSTKCHQHWTYVVDHLRKLEVDGCDLGSQKTGFYVVYMMLYGFYIGLYGFKENSQKKRSALFG